MPDQHRTDPWVPYRSAVTHQLASCHDYLTHLQRSLAVEIAPDRHHFADKSAALADAAQLLGRLGPRACARSAGHPGLPYRPRYPRRQGDHRCPGPRRPGRGRHPSLGWTAPSVGRDIAHNHTIDPDDLGYTTRALSAIADNTHGVADRVQNVTRHARVQRLDARLERVPHQPATDVGLDL